MLRKILLCTILMLVAISYGQVLSKARAVPTILNYQGYLTDTLESPIDDSLDMTFKIYDAATLGNELWSETQSNIPVERGVFSVLLGKVTPIPDTVFTTGTDRWLELTLEGAQTLAPRTRITAVGYAYTATYSDTADYAKSGAADADWVISGNDMYSNVHGNIGIGMTQPSDSAKLHVESNNLYAGLFTSDSLDHNTRVVHSEFTGSGNYDAAAVYGRAIPADYYGYGGYFEGGYAGVHGLVQATGVNDYYGAWGAVFGGSGDNYGLYGEASGAGTNYGVYGHAYGAGTNWGGYFEGNGYFSDKVGIGTMNPSDSAKLHVESNNLYAGLFTSDSLSYNTHVIHSEFTGSGNYQAVAVYGKSIPADFHGTGGYFEGGYAGVQGLVEPTGANVYYGALGKVNGGSGLNHGLYGEATGAGTNYGVYGYAGGAGTNWGGFFLGDGYFSGKVGLGTINPSDSAKLHVESNSLYAGLFTSDSQDNFTHVIHSEYTGGGYYTATAIYGKSNPAAGCGTGGYFEGGQTGVYGRVYLTESGMDEDYYGVRGEVSGGADYNYGIYGEASGASSINYGVYGVASGGPQNWAGYFKGNGYFSNQVGIGTISPSNETKLHINATTDDFGVLVDVYGTAGSEIGLHTATSKYASLVKNAYYASGAWQRFDVSSGAFLQEINPGGDALLRVAAAGTNPISWTNAVTIKSSGKVGINTTGPTAALDVNGSTGYNQIRMRTSYTPSGSADPNGNVGDIAWDNSYVYVKTGAGWRRAALSSW